MSFQIVSYNLADGQYGAELRENGSYVVESVRVRGTREEAVAAVRSFADWYQSERDEQVEEL